MERFRQYGRGVPRIVLVHGGPGAPGELRPLARILEKKGHASLEPFQSATTIDGQVEELREQLEEAGVKRCLLLGYSWGSWLSILFAERYPEMVERLILVSTPPFTYEESLEINTKRMGRLSEEQRSEVAALIKALDSHSKEERIAAFRSLAFLFKVADSYSLLTDKEYVEEYQVDTFKSIWSEAEQRRASGALFESFKSLQLPLVFVHGDEDPHPSTAILKMLKGLELDAMYYEIPNCGHSPWIERFGQFRFLSIIENELRLSAL